MNECCECEQGPGEITVSYNGLIGEVCRKCAAELKRIGSDPPGTNPDGLAWPSSERHMEDYLDNLSC